MEASAAPAHDALVMFLLAGWLTLAWGAVAALSLARLALGMWRVSRCARRGTELNREEFIIRAAQKLGMRRPVRVVLSPEAKVPMSAGFLDSVVILPVQAAEWSNERLELVLLHELAHVKRRDCLAVMVAEIALALWWFHPLAWIARRSIRRDAELAADDLVLRTGARPSVYAEHLLSIVRSLGDSHQFEPAMAMGRSSDLDGRLRALLELRRRGPSSPWGRGIAAALVGLSLALGAVWPTHAAQPRPVCMRARHAAR
jgi:beta-lactamase regulating signal transducer with metallopeptidase domain